jgi:hypothetical protein
LPGWLIYVDLNTNGVFDREVEPAALTGTNGHYRIRVEAGEYRVRELMQPDWSQVHPGGPHFAHTVTVGNGVPARHVDFGNRYVGTGYGFVAGRKLLAPRHAEPETTLVPEGRGLPDWIIYVDVNGNDAFDPHVDIATRTGSGGHYVLRVPAGSNTVREVRRDGWTQVRPGAGQAFEYVVNVESGRTVNALDFVNRSHDTDADGTSDFEERLFGSDEYAAESVAALVVAHTDRDAVSIRFHARAGRTYRLQQCAELTAGEWRDIGAPIVVSSDGPLSLRVETEDAPALYYRVIAEN